MSFLTVPADTWMAMLAETTLRMSVILLAAGAIAVLLRRASANLRHLVWALAFGGALLLPLAASYLPSVNLPVPRPLQALVRPAVDAAMADLRSDAATPPGSFAPAIAGDPLEDVEDLNAETAMSAPHADARRVPDAASLAGVAASPGSGDGGSAPSRAAVGLSWQQLLVGLWAGGVVLLLLRIGVGIAATWRIGRRAERPRDDDWEGLSAELSRRIGLTRPVRVLSSRHTSMPMTWGWARPVVLVPETGAAWSAARKRVVLLHELNHVTRHDCASQLVAHVACAVYWFNPLVWLAARALRIERERACDEAVVRDGTQASSYADHLLDIARGYRPARWTSLAAVAMARRSQLEGRLLSILEAGQRRRPSRRTVLGLGAVMAGVILMLAAVTPTTRAAAPVEAGVTMATEVSLAGGAALMPTDPGRPAVEQTPARQTPAADDAEARNEARAAAERLRAAASQDSARGAQAEAAERQVVELERRLVEFRERDIVIDQQEIQDAVEHALEAAQNVLADLDVDVVVDGVAITEQVRERLDQFEFRGVQGGVFRGDQEPLDPRVVELFMESLSDDDAEVRERAAWGLGRNRVETAVGPLSNTLRDENAEVRERAAWALGMIRGDTAVGPLSAALDDAEPDVAEQAAWALGMIRSETAVNPLVGALDAADPDVREQAAWALGMIRSPSGVSGLAAALDDTEAKVRVEVVEALGRIRDASAVEALGGALSDGEPRVRREAAEALGRIRDAGAVEDLVAALGDAEPGVAEHAAEALGMIRDAGAVDGLVRALQHEDADVAEAAAEALGRIRSDQAIDGLIAALRNAQGDLAEEIVEALGRIGGDRALDALIEMTGDASPAVRKAVIEALSGRQWSGNANPNPNPNPRPE